MSLSFTSEIYNNIYILQFYMQMLLSQSIFELAPLPNLKILLLSYFLMWFICSKFNVSKQKFILFLQARIELQERERTAEFTLHYLQFFYFISGCKKISASFTEPEQWQCFVCFTCRWSFAQLMNIHEFSIYSSGW